MESREPKVLFVEPFGQHEGHPPIESKRVIDALTEAGVHVTMVTFDGVRENWIETSKIEQHISVTSQSGFFSPLLRLIPKLYRFPMTIIFAFFLETLFTLLLTLIERGRGNYDAIHLYDGNPPFAIPFVAANFVKKSNFIVNIYSPSLPAELVDWPEKFKRARKKRDSRDILRLALIRMVEVRGLKALQGVIYRRALRRNRFSFICHTQEVKESYKTYLGGILYDRIHTIPLGRKPPEDSLYPQSQIRQYLHLPQEAKILLGFGTSHFGKNIEVIFQGVKDMPETFYLLFAGIHGMRGDINRDPSILAKKYGWSENTIVVQQFIPEEEKPYYFYASDAILLSYVKDLAASASLLNEACQFQLPAIASDGGQLGGYVKNYNLGLTFIPENPESLCQAIASFLNLTEEEKLGIKANFFRFADDLPWREVAERYKALYLRQVPTPFPEPAGEK